ncbi:MAG: hypothetical protein RIM84_21610 [Alphaproteobacteria bacterium]
MGVALHIADDDGRARDALRAILGDSNVNAETLLATDYLNHFNEVVMLLDLVADMPECLEDLRDWAPKSYEQHFLDSGLSDRQLAVEAYRLSPRQFREPFDYAVERMDRLVSRSITEMGTADPEAAAAIALATCTALQRLIDVASGLIHGRDVALDQDAIDRVIGDDA